MHTYREGIDSSKGIDMDRDRDRDMECADTYRG
jgi:hypothetical protein